MPFFKTKKVTSIVLLVLVTVVLAGCTPQQSGTNNQNTQVTLQMWGVYWDESVMQSLIDEYQRLNTNVKINYANRWPGGESKKAAQLYQDEVDRVLREGNTAEIPDIFMVENTWAGNYERYTESAPSSVIDVSTVQSAFFPAVTRDFISGNAVRGLPMWGDTLAVLYNRDMLADLALSRPPTTWTEFKNVAIQLTQTTNNKITRGGFAAGTATNVSFGPEILNLLMLQNGVAMLDSQGGAAFSEDSDSVTALQFYKSFNNVTWDDALGNDAKAFLEGKVAMIVAPSWRYQEILLFNDHYKLGLNVGVSPMPQLEGGTVSTVNWGTYWGAMVSKARPNSAEAWKFVKWLTDKDQQEKLRQNELIDRKFFGFLYPRRDMADKLQRDQYLTVYNAALANSESWYMVDGLAVRGIFLELISGATSAGAVSNAENKVQTIINNKGRL